MLDGVLDIDGAFPGNALVPGGAPIEYSFSERSPHLLRFEVEPYGAVVGPAERLARATQAVREIAGNVFGASVVERFDAQRSLWVGDTPLRFGAFVGAVLGPAGLVEVKLYREVGPTEALPPTLAASAREVASRVRGVRPHFASLALTRTGITERIYLVCEEGLRLLALEPLMRRLDLAHRLPMLADTVAAVTRGPLFLPPQGALIALRRSEDRIELKLELLGAALPASPIVALEAVRRALAPRPGSLLAFDRFVSAVEATQSAPAQVAVVSVRCDPFSGCDLNVYLRS